VTPVVQIEEFTDKINGKTAAEWAKSGGRMDVADELLYRYNTQLPMMTDAKLEKLTLVVKKQEHSIEQLVAKLDTMKSDIKLVGIYCFRLKFFQLYY
jgi:hypothetical protein